MLQLCLWLLVAALSYGESASAGQNAAGETRFQLVVDGGEARRSSAGVFHSGSGNLVRQLWANRETPGRDNGLLTETIEVVWDGKDDSGVQLTGGRLETDHFELRWIDTSAVSYDWQGVVGNTGPSTGQHVLRSEDWQQDLAIAGEVGVRAWGYNEAMTGCSMFSTASASSAISIAHSDYHRVFALAATDGEVGYFANTGGATDPNSFFHTGATFVIGIDLKSDCEHNFTAAGRSQCTLGHGQVPGGGMGNWSWCKPAGSQCAYPGSECANGGAAKGNYDGCNGKAEYFHSVLDFTLSQSLVNDTADGLNPSCKPTPQKGCNGTGTGFLHAPTGIAVQRGTGRKLFVAHAFLNEVRVLDKKTGASLCNVTMEMPRRMALSMDGASLWVIVGNTTVTKYDANKLCQSVGDAEATPAALLSLPRAHLALPAALSVSPKTNEVAVADLATSQVQVFSESGAFLKSLGQSGGYATGGPEVSAKRFFWLNSTQVFLAHEDDGSLWVADAANLRTLHVDSEGRFIDSTDYVVASYSSAVHSEQPTRVFSNYREYAVKYSALATPLNESWALVRNWAAGLDANWTTDNSHFEGFHTVVATADNKTVGMVRMANGKDSLVELPSDGTGLRLIYQLPSGGYSLERGASLRYSVDHWQRGSQAAGVQEIWEVAYDVAAGNWSLPGRLVTSFATASDQLASRFAGVQPSFPTTAKGDFVIFDGATGKNESYNHAPNQGNHLGVVKPGANSSFTWQASPWGEWDVAGSPIVLDGINCTFHAITNADGRYGGNDSAINYGGSYAQVEGHNIVYGFFGEFWKNSEANQFLHFHDSGLFIGQFGTLSQFGSMGLNPQIPGDMGGEFEEFNYALPGEAGNSFSPSLVRASDNLVYFYHNDESQHDGVHQWVLKGAESLLLKRGLGNTQSFDK